MKIRSTAALAAAIFCFSCNSMSDSSSEEAVSQSIEKLDKVVSSDQQSDSTAGFWIGDTLYGANQAGNATQQKQNNLPLKQIDWDKKIVKTASLNAEVKDYKAFPRN